MCVLDGMIRLLLPPSAVSILEFKQEQKKNVRLGNEPVIYEVAAPEVI